MRRMHPFRKKPSVSPDMHVDWSAVGAQRLARAGAVERRCAGDRPSRLFLNGRVADKIGNVDLARIEEIASRNCGGQMEGRSRMFALEHPLRMYDANHVSRPIRSVQLKGVMLDRKRALCAYGGVGYCADYYFADTRAVYQRFEVIRDPIGGLVLSEAVREYAYLLAAYPLLAGGVCEVPLPIAWGIYDDFVWQGEELGFIILGLPALPAVREQAYHSALDSLRDMNDFLPMERLLRRRGQGMRVMHDFGFLTQFRHFLNVSFGDGFVVMHDLGDRRSVLRSQLINDDQFFAEAFCNLMYAITPDEHIVERAPRAVDSAETVLKHLDRFTAATLEGYFGMSASELPFTFNILEEVFREAFDIPFSSLTLPAAKTFRRLLSGGLEDIVVPTRPQQHTKPPFPEGQARLYCS